MEQLSWFSVKPDVQCQTVVYMNSTLFCSCILFAQLLSYGCLLICTSIYQNSHQVQRQRVSVLEGNKRRGLVYVDMKHITEGCTRKAFEIVLTVKIIIKMDLFVITNKLVSSLSSHLQKLASIESERTCICKLKTYAFVLQ